MTAPVLLSRPLVVAGVAFLLGVLVPTSAAATCGWGAVGAALGTLALARARRLLALLPFVMTFVLTGATARATVEAERPSAATRLPAEAEVGMQPPLAPGGAGQTGFLEGVVTRAVERGPEEDVYVLEVSRMSPARHAPGRSTRGVARAHAPREVGAPPACGRAGDRVRFVGAVAPLPIEPGPRDRPAWRVYLPRRQACIVLERPRSLGLGIRIEHLREAVHAAIDRALTGDRAGLVRAFATGDRSGISSSTAEDFRASGLAHLVAVSGLNLAIVAGLFVVALGAGLRFVPRVALGFGVRRSSALVAIPVVVAYTLLVGATPSAVRAAAMVLVLLSGHLVSRRRDALSALALAAAVMLARDAGAIFDPSFQLSFAAVLALFFLHPALADALGLSACPRLLRAALEVAVASAAAALGTAPLIAYHFQSISLVGLVANVPAHPIASFVLVPLALLGGLVGVASDTVARPFLWTAGASAELLIVLARVSASVPGATLSVPPPTALEGALFVGVLGAWALRPRHRHAGRVALALVVALVLEVALVQAARVWSDELRVTVLAVGQGDAIVIEFPGGHVAVVDAGPLPHRASPSAAQRILVPFLRARRIAAIDLLVITHPHADHVGGFEDVARALPIREVWWTGDRREGPDAALAALAGHPSLRRAELHAGDVRSFGGVRVEWVGPRAPPHQAPIVNDASIVLRLVHGRRAIVLAGDAERAEEQDLVRADPGALAADVLKLGHHGSRTSSSERFLEAVRPAFAIVSAGRNNVFGFPHAEVLERLESRRVRVFRTDLQGAIEVVTDGERLEVNALVR